VTGYRTALALSALAPTVPTPKCATACAKHESAAIAFLHIVATAGARLNIVLISPFDVGLVPSLFAALPLVRPRPAVGAKVVAARAASDVHIDSFVADLTGKTGLAIALGPRTEA